MPKSPLLSRRAMMLAGGCVSSLFIAAIPSAAIAQDATAQQPAEGPGATNATQPQAEPGAIVVTGIRRSLQDSIAIKRRERSVVEAVSAEEIGKLPDVSLAESIGRRTGNTAHRVPRGSEKV